LNILYWDWIELMNDNVRQLIQFCFCKQHSMIIGHFMLLVFCIGSSHLLLTCSLWVAYVRWQQRGNIHRFIGRNLIAHFNWSNYNVSFATIEIIHTWSLSMKCLWLNLLYQFEPLYFKQQPWLTITMIDIHMVFRQTRAMHGAPSSSS
jgi:hypothetical protein